MCKNIFNAYIIFCNPDCLHLFNCCVFRMLQVAMLYLYDSELFMPKIIAVFWGYFLRMYF